MADFPAAFATLKQVLAKHAKHLSVQRDGPNGYAVVTKSASPFPQHKGQPMFFGAVRVGKAYVSFHLVPIYMNPALHGTISPELRKRMQGKACFNFKDDPPPAVLRELQRLTQAALDDWRDRKWL